jgi:hypothetical protein
MKKVIIPLILSILACLVFRSLHLAGTQAITDLSSVVVGIIYIILAAGFFRRKEKRALNILFGSALLVASAFAILPFLFYFLNSFTFVININYNDILFNYYKSLLNSLIGLLIFLFVCLFDLLLPFSVLANEEKKKHKIGIILTLALIAVVSMLTARNLGYHLSFSRTIVKITILALACIGLPFLFYKKLVNRLFVASLLITLLYFITSINPKYLFSANFSGTHWFVYTKPVRQITGSSIDTVATINSFKKITDNFYSMTFSGDYSAILESNNKKCMEESMQMQRNCSLFTSFGDTAHYLFARNFDNPQGWKCKTLLCRTNPSDGYSSLTLVRLADLGYDVAEDLEQLSYERKKNMVNAVFYTPDGMNEKGVVVALAAVDGQNLNEDTGKAYINCTYLIREILDHAKNVDEATAIIRKYNIMNDVWSGSLDQHLLIADASGRSVIAEISKGEFRFTPNTANWQATTNSPSYALSIAEQKQNCTRFAAISTRMEFSKGKSSTDEALSLLQQIGHQYTEWSAVYDISQREMTVVIDYDFSKKYQFSLKSTKLY